MPRLARFLSVCLLLSLPAAARSAEMLDLAPDLYTPREQGEPDTSQAARLVEHARTAAQAGQVSQALQLATQSLQHNPNEPTCRRVLGYEKADGLWLTPFQRKQVQRGFVWDTRFGWVTREELPRYEAGERRNGRRWLSAKEDAERHSVIEDGWRVRTDHFQVTTNHSLEAAASLAAELERLFQVWRQLFAGYYLGEAEVRARFEGARTARGRSRPFNIFYHRDRAGYVAHLRHKQPRIAETLGIYFDDTREAHFYPAEDQASRSTLYHEAVHQLFFESKRAKRQAGAKHGFWAIEGVACYFESLAPVAQGRYEIGAATAGRLPSARIRLLHPDPAMRFYMPMGEMAGLSMKDLQRRSDLPQLYGQAAAVATFLMHADGGKRREAFVGYLADLYTGKTRPGSLAAALGEPLDELETSYRRWIERLPD